MSRRTYYSGDKNIKFSLRRPAAEPVGWKSKDGRDSLNSKASRRICALLAGVPDEFFFSVQSESDWEELISEATGHMILPSLFSRLRDVGWIEYVPSEIVSFLHSVENLNCERNDRIFAEAIGATRLLNNRKIEPIALKGIAYLLMHVCPANGVRFMSDIDFLVPEPDFESAFHVLVDAGFRCYQTTRLQRVLSHSAPLARDHSFSVDLHRLPGIGPCNSVLPASEILKQSVAYQVNGAVIRVPSPEHLIIHQIIHSQVHHGGRERIWTSLRSMYDFFVLHHRFGELVDWHSIEQRFRNAGLYGVLAIYLLYIQNVLGLKSPIPIRLGLQDRFRWYTNNLVRTIPLLRFVDPVYVGRSTLLEHFRYLFRILYARRGSQYLMQKLWTRAKGFKTM